MSDGAATTNGPSGTGDGLGGRVRGAVGRLYRRFRSERTPGDLGETAFEVLGVLSKNGPQSLTELSSLARVAPGSMSQSVNRLASAGYATREADPQDGRRVLIAATDRGIELARETRAVRNAWLDGRLAALSPDDRAVLARACSVLDRIADA